jgi:UDP-3-O-[3-hydroxymyristoyl] glucosamine N-acyltransferase
MEVESLGKPAIRVANPRAAFAQVLALFVPAPEVEVGVHPTAVIGADVRLGKDVSIAVKDGKVFLNNAAQVIITDINTSNGVIHVIDSVILPPQ